MKHRNLSESEQRKNVVLTQPAANSRYHQHKQPKIQDSRRLNETMKNRLPAQNVTKQHLSTSRPKDIHHKQYISKAPNVCSNFLKEYRTRVRESSSDSDSENETDVDSLYDNDKSFKDFQSESLDESDYKISDEINESIQNLQKGLNRITTNYVRRVKLHVDSTMSNLKIREKRKQLMIHKKVDERGAGDKKPSQTEDLFKKMELMKKECYQKIEANLNTLKNIDNVTSEIFLNYSSTKPG